MKRNLLAVLAVFLMGLAAVWMAVGRSAPVSAQANGEVWESSAEAPEGTPIEAFSVADNLSLNNQQEELEGGGLVSWRVTGAALKPRENDVSYSINSNGSCTYVTAGDASTVWNIPIQLHNGSVVDTLRMYYYDASGSNSTAWFTVYDLYGSLVDEWSVSTSGNSGNRFNDSVQIDHEVDYSVYNYLLNWRPTVTGSTLQLCGFRVFYTPPPYGLGFIPAVLNP